jgi:Ca2+-binding RTX toxin-like protein
MAAKSKSRTTDDGETLRGRPENPGGVHEPLAGNTLTGGRRVDPPGQEGNEHSQRPDVPPGHDRGGEESEIAGETLTGTEAGETLGGSAGDDSLDGAAGDDTLDGGEGSDQLVGGAGNDVFVAGAAGEAVDGLDKVIDFTPGEDSLEFTGDIVLTEDQFATETAADYAAALAAANTVMADGSVKFVAVQVGGDVIVFGETDGLAGADEAIVLVGRTLTDVSHGDVG